MSETNVNRSKEGRNADDRAQSRMALVVNYFQGYVRTYTEQEGYQTYSDETFLDDMLYGIGLALSVGTPKDNSGPSGFERFKQALREHIG